jgi:hypothetical protein
VRVSRAAVVASAQLKQRITIDDWFFLESVPEEQHANAFQIVSQTKTVLLYATTTAERDAWCQAIEECIEVRWPRVRRLRHQRVGRSSCSVTPSARRTAQT